MLGSTIDWGAWKLSGNLTTIDLIAAGTNALNGALLCRRPDHYKNWTVVGVLLMAIIGGVGGGITRDVLVNKVPSALTNPSAIGPFEVAAFGVNSAWNGGVCGGFQMPIPIAWQATLGNDTACSN